MPEVQFKGKEFVYNHHLSVPFRPLIAHPKKSIGKNSENLIIHGDNLHALKALLPRFSAKIGCVLIDPPYNTGKESWCYNDNVNSPIMQEWLNSKKSLNQRERHVGRKYVHSIRERWTDSIWIENRQA